MSLARAIIMMLLLAASSGCATIVHGTTQEVTVACSLPDAVITLDGHPVKPGIIEMKRGEDHVVGATAQGFEPVRVPIHSSISTGWAVSETILGLAGFIGYGIGEVVTFIPLLVDSLDGAICSLDRDSVVLQLEPSLPPLPAWVAEPDELARFCPKCGTAFARDSKFCASCGAHRDGAPPSK